jgi:hypothetical protein
MNSNANTEARAAAINNSLLTPKYSVTQQALVLTALAIACIVFADPAAAVALAPVTRTSGIVRDTIVAICLAVMTAAWGFGGMKMAFAGASLRDMQAPLIGGTIAGGAAAMAAAFIA